ncbi:MAG: DUF4349 domain-containing protein [Clostridia bacterium]|nr:DUF4349 domain-containing protein [Clostridia bacterium]
MNERYDLLLDRLLDGIISEEELLEMQAMETADPSLKQEKTLSLAIRDQLLSLAEDIEDEPASLHARWMQKAMEEESSMSLHEDPKALSEETVPEKKQHQKPDARRITRYLAIAACLIFLLGGTALNRDTYPTMRTTDESGVTTVSTTGILKQSLAFSSDVNGLTMTASAKSTAYDLGTGAMEDGLVLAESVMDMEEDWEEVSEEAIPDTDGDESTSKIIRTGSMTVESRNFDDACQQLMDACTEGGGYVASSSMNVNYNGLRTAHMTLRLPSSAFDQLMHATFDGGEITYQDQYSYDATESYRDTQARLENQKILLERLRSLTTDAADLKDVLELERQIADTQSTIDSLTRSLMNTDQRVAYSTLDVTLQEKKTATKAAVRMTFPERILQVGQDALEDFLLFLQDMVLFLVSALPYLCLIALLILCIRLIAVRRKKKAGGRKQ